MDLHFNPFDPAYRKYAVVVAALVLTILIVILPVVPQQYKAWVSVGIMVLTALGVKQVSNAPLSTGYLAPNQPPAPAPGTPYPPAR